MRKLILGTAGHIDHGKTALVRALTGVDTDRLKEEKERGITVDLGFAEYRPQEEVHFGVVDVPGHEGFIRNMLAGATGMDLVLLVIAADEGVMPQTREHLAIVRLLGVPRLAVALTKSDQADPEWMELVQEEVRELLLGTPYYQAPIVPVSSVTREGLERLSSELVALGLSATERGEEDVARLPIDRVFTIRGAGTVVTGTLWSGTLTQGARVKILPGDRNARIRSLQAHGQEVDRVQPGGRVAVGLSGSGIHHRELFRGQTLVEADGWVISWMLTCRLSVLVGPGWELEQNQRVRVHLGTAEVLARVVLLDTERLREGEEGWVQLRLEEPLLARVGDHLVVRSYSPVTTLGGGQVAEVLPKKRRRLTPGEDRRLSERLDGTPRETMDSLLQTAEWAGAAVVSLPQRLGHPPPVLCRVVLELEGDGTLVRVQDHLFSQEVWLEGERRVLSALEDYHQSNPLRPGIPLEELRQVPPGPRGPEIAEALLQGLKTGGRVGVKEGFAFLVDFRPTLSDGQAALRSRLRIILEEAALSPPTVREMEELMGEKGDFEGVLRLMEGDGEVLALDPEMYFPSPAVWKAGRAVVEALGGSDDLGPADFRDALPLSRKHLLPLLRYFDRTGITTRREDGRKVSQDLPEGWGTSL
jgi:selenocysteine-specific elongation factor